MVQDKDKVYLQHILDEINRIKEFFYDVEETGFVDSEITEKHYAIVRSLEIIGEAANKVSAELRKNHREVEWNSMIGMRNKIIHEYMNVDYQVVWDTAKIDLPPLKTAIENLLKS